MSRLGEKRSLWAKARAAVALGAMTDAHNRQLDEVLFKLQPREREDQHVDALVRQTRHLNFFAYIPPAERYHLARCWSFEIHKHGEYLCRSGDEDAALILVLRGEVAVEERRLVHNLGEDPSQASGTPSSPMRKQVLKHGVGSSIGNFAVASGQKKIDYTARAALGGCAVLRVPRADYERIMREREQKWMLAAVTMLGKSRFFAEWSNESLQRLYFMLERVRLHAGEDVVLQGDVADSCFIISHGECDIVLTSQAAPEKGNIKPQERIITTLPVGSLVGEAALLDESAGGRRNATVRAAVGGQRVYHTTQATVEVLKLSKRAFLSLSEHTLHSIRETAKYNSACTKEPHQRTEEDLERLVQRTAHLEYCRQLPLVAHRELCRFMRYQRVAADTVLFECDSPADRLYVLLEGECTIARKDQGQPVPSPVRPRRHSSDEVVMNVVKGSRRQKLRRNTMDSIAATAIGVTRVANNLAALMVGTASTGQPTLLRAGEAAGESELLFSEEKYQTTLVASTDVTLMVLERDAYARQLKPHRGDKLKDLFVFLRDVPPLAGLSAFELHALAKRAQPKSIGEGQLCLASLPHNTGLQGLVVPYSKDSIFIIRTGEARLICSLDEPASSRGTEAGSTFRTAASPMAASPAAATPPGQTLATANRALEAALGSKVAPLASLGPKDVITSDLLNGDANRQQYAGGAAVGQRLPPRVGWCLQPRGTLEFLVFPRREWEAAINGNTKARLNELGSQRTQFFKQRLSAARREVESLHCLAATASSSSSSSSSSKLRPTASLPSMQRRRPRSPELQEPPSLYNGDDSLARRNYEMRQQIEMMRAWASKQQAEANGSSASFPRRTLPSLSASPSAPLLRKSGLTVPGSAVVERFDEVTASGAVALEPRPAMQSVSGQARTGRNGDRRHTHSSPFEPQSVLEQAAFGGPEPWGDELGGPDRSGLMQLQDEYQLKPRLRRDGSPVGPSCEWQQDPLSEISMSAPPTRSTSMGKFKLAGTPTSPLKGDGSPQRASNEIPSNNIMPGFAPTQTRNMSPPLRPESSSSRMRRLIPQPRSAKTDAMRNRF